MKVCRKKHDQMESVCYQYVLQIKHIYFLYLTKPWHTNLLLLKSDFAKKFWFDMCFIMHDRELIAFDINILYSLVILWGFH